MIAFLKVEPQESVTCDRRRVKRDAGSRGRAVVAALKPWRRVESGADAVAATEIKPSRGLLKSPNATATRGS
jgi:uridine kinase